MKPVAALFALTAGARSVTEKCSLYNRRCEVSTPISGGIIPTPVPIPSSRPYPWTSKTAPRASPRTAVSLSPPAVSFDLDLNFFAFGCGVVTVSGFTAGGQPLPITKFAFAPAGRGPTYMALSSPPKEYMSPNRASNKTVAVVVASTETRALGAGIG
ncbi:hypothetical protein F5Y15DRAFT_430580 [Xylariaceae sp. FL0016]|nr:hypothetical protein F5Y15DRAFT_430580 [Xylariaceae sp. FL0016]